MSNKIKIGFEITDVWNRAEFRELIRLILYNPQLVCEKEDTDFELFLISNDSSTYIGKVADTINTWYPGTVILDSGHIIICNFRQDKADACQNNTIDIYFDADNLTIILLEATVTNGVLVRTEADRYNVKQKYVTEFENILKNVISEKENPEC